MPGRTSHKDLLRDLSREPTLYFLLVALALFGVNAALRAARSGRVIEIDRGLVAARVARIEAGRGAPLTREQRQQVEEDYVNEQVLVREARTMGLQDDAQVENLLAQKMLDVLSADVIQPSDDELQTYFDAHHQRYATKGTATVDEVVVGTSGPLPRSLEDELGRGVAPDALESGGVPVSHDVLTTMTREELASLFGAVMADRVFEAPAGSWVGPHISVRGQHWLRVTDRAESTPVPLDAVREKVRLDWVRDQEQARLRRRIGELRGHYAIVFRGEDSAQ